MQSTNYRWIGAALILFTAASARADVRYTTEVKFGAAEAKSEGNASMAPAMRTTTFVKDNNERVESSMKIGPFQSNTVTLTLCGKKQVLKMDPALKVYTVSPLGAPSFGPAASGPGGMMGGRKKPSGKGGGEGKIVTTFTVQNLGNEKLFNLDTQHSMVTIRTQSSGCPGNSDTTMKMEMWMAPIPTMNCPDRYAGGAPAATGDGGSDDGCKVTYEMKGDVDAMKTLSNGMVVQMKMYDDKGKVAMTQELREHSKANLDKALFEIPAGFTKVTEAEFQKKQQDAMMKAMMKGAGRDMEEAMNEAAEAEAAEAAEEAKAPVEEKKEEKKPRIKLPRLPF